LFFGIFVTSDNEVRLSRAGVDVVYFVDVAYVVEVVAVCFKVFDFFLVLGIALLTLLLSADGDKVLLLLEDRIIDE